MQRSNLEKDSPTVESKRRAWVLLTIFVILFLIIIARLFYLQIYRYKFFKEKSLEQRTRFITLAADRGDILDRNGKVLATSIDVYSVYLAPREIENKEETAQKLAPLLNEKPEKILPKMNNGKSFLWLKRKIDKNIAEEIKKADLAGVGLLKEKKRIYPKGTLASQILGFVGIDNQGLSGLELGEEQYLKGEEGKLVMESDPTGHLIGSLREIQPTTPGMEVTLTIDETIQYIAERELKKGVKEHGGIWGSIVVMNPRTGEILAMASYPDFDPNYYYKSSPKTWQPGSVSRAYEPGSTFKVITSAAGVEEGLYEPDTVINCPVRLKVGDRIIENSHTMSPNPPVKTLADVLAESLNTGIAQVGIKLGPSNFIKHIKAFGFGEKTEVGLPGESAGIVREVKDWNPPDVGMITFGQAIAVTPLQLTAAISAIANDGNLVRPRIINKIESLDGKFVKSPGTELLRRVISSSTAAKVKGMMEGVVYKPNGTARRTKMSRWKVAAKTGTAQKPAPGGGYMEGHYIASLVGFLPSDNPQLTILVVVDDPKGTYWGETVAAPVFKEVAEETLRYLNVP